MLLRATWAAIIYQMRETDLELLADFVLSLQEGRLMLSPRDYDVLQSWLELGWDPDHLLLELSEILPRFYENPDKRPSGLEKIRKHVDKRLDTKRSG